MTGPKSRVLQICERIYRPKTPLHCPLSLLSLVNCQMKEIAMQNMQNIPLNSQFCCCLTSVIFYAYAAVPSFFRHLFSHRIGLQANFDVHFDSLCAQLPTEQVISKWMCVFTVFFCCWCVFCFGRVDKFCIQFKFIFAATRFKCFL